MKKIFFIIALVSPVALIAQDRKYSLKGKVGSIDAPSKIYLSYKKASGYELDSSVLHHGQFEFKGILGEPVNAVLRISYTGGEALYDPHLQALSFYLEPGAIYISSPDSLVHATITGSPASAAYERLKMALKPLDGRKSAMMEQYYSRQRNGAQADTAFMTEFNKRYKELSEEQRLVYFDFVKANPATYVSLDALKQAGGAAPDYYIVAPLFNSLSPAIKKTSAGRQYANDLEVMKVSAIGMMAPDFTQNTPEEKPLRLSDFRGNYVLIDFWASWCGPCRAENPHVVAAYRIYHDRGLEIIGVSLDDARTKNAWINAIQQDSLSWHQVSDLKGWENEVAKQYRIQSVPANFLLDRSGKIIGRNLKGGELIKMLEDIFE